MEGEKMYRWASDLFPICRSLTGPGVRETLRYLQDLLPELSMLEVPSGTQAFDWTVPNEWTIRDAYILNDAGERVVDFRANNLHLVGYSIPVDAWYTRAELDAHLHSIPEQPDAIPYVTSYYAPYWGFCLTHAQRLALPDGRYRVVVDSTLAPGVMNVGELLVPGDQPEEVLLSANICHPSLANNEASGMVVVAALAQWLRALPRRRYSYRLLFLPETIGSIWYVSTHLEELRRRVRAGFVVTCAGDDRAYSYVPSRSGTTLADRVALHVLSSMVPDFNRYSFLDRGSDERQYCSPGVDLPVCSVMRSKYGTYPEYHTSLDDLRVINPQGLQGSFDVLRSCLEVLEENDHFQATFHCEPQLGKRGLYPSLSQAGGSREAQQLLDILAYGDGAHDLISVAERLGVSAMSCQPAIRQLVRAGLLQRVAPGA